jgi:hypothetical protein
VADGFDLLILLSKSNIYSLCELGVFAVKVFFRYAPSSMRYLSAEAG